MKLFKDTQVYKEHLKIYNNDISKAKSHVPFESWAYKHYKNDPNTLDMLVSEHAKYEADKIIQEIDFVNSSCNKEIREEIDAELDAKVSGPTVTGFGQRFVNWAKGPSGRKLAKYATIGLLTAGLVSAAAYASIQNASATSHADVDIPTDTYTPVQVSDDGEGASVGIFADGKIAYSVDAGSGSQNIIIKNLSSGSKNIFGPFNTAVSGHFDFDSKHVVVANDVGSGADIIAIDANTGNVTNLNQDGAFPNQISPEVSNGKTVYLFYNPYNSSAGIEVKDLGTNLTEIVSTYNAVGNPDIYNDLNGTKVVFEKDNKIYFKNLDNGTEGLLHNDSSFTNQRLPAIYKDNVVFAGSENGSVDDIYLKNLISGELLQLTNTPTVGESNPEINGNLVTWDSSGKIFVYKINTGEIIEIADSTPFHNSPTVFGENGIEKVIYPEAGKTMMVTLAGSTPPVNNAPTLTDILDSTIGYNATWEKDIVASDLDSDPLTISVSGTAFEKIGNKIALKDAYRTQPGTYEGKITVDDGRGGIAEDTFNVTVNPQGTPANNAPTLDDIVDASIAYGSEWERAIVASDPDSDPLTINVTGDAFEKVGSKVVLKDAYKTQPGTYEGRISVDDSRGGIAEDVFNVTVAEQGVPVNHAPVISGLPSTYNVTPSDNFTLNLNDFVTDPDGDALTYTVNSNVLDEVSPGVYMLKDNVKAGTYDVSINVTDPQGLGADTLTQITVEDKPTTSGGMPWYIPGGIAAAGIGGLFAFLFKRKGKEKPTKHTNVKPKKVPASIVKPKRIPASVSKASAKADAKV